MSRKHRATRIAGQFAPRLIEMMESPAYRSLTLAARRVLDRVEIELAHHGGHDNGGLPVTYDDFEHYGIHRHQIAPAIREAVALKFLEITKSGRAGNDRVELRHGPGKAIHLPIAGDEGAARHSVL